MNPQLAQFVALMRRFPFCVACAVLTLGLGVAAWFLWQDIVGLENAHEDRAKEGQAILSLLVGGSTQRAELAAVHEIARRIDDNLLIENNLPENSEYFYKFEARTGTHLVEMHQLNSPITDNSPLYRRIPYTLRVTGAYEQVAAFLLALETGPRLVNIPTFNFSRQAATSGGGGSGRDSGRAAATDAPAAGVVLDLNLEMLGKK
jgi:Tfp pilus assembly protein PilO